MTTPVPTVPTKTLQQPPTDIGSACAHAIYEARDAEGTIVIVESNGRTDRGSTPYPAAAFRLAMLNPQRNNLAPSPLYHAAGVDATTSWHWGRAGYVVEVNAERADRARTQQSVCETFAGTPEGFKAAVAFMAEHIPDAVDWASCAVDTMATVDGVR